MSLGWLLVAFAISIGFVLLAIIKFKMHPFLALLVGAILMGLLGGLPLVNTTDAEGAAVTGITGAIAAGFGGTLQGIGIIIVLGVTLGHLLHKSGCTQQIAALMLRATGEKGATTAIGLTGYIVSIPVFFDAAFVILINLVKDLSRKGKIPFISLVTALAMGLIVTHSMVIPTPGPLVVADNMGANLGWFALYAILVSLPAALVGGVLYGKRLGKNKAYSQDFANAFADEEADEPAAEIGKQPSGGLGIFLIVLPIVIILLGTFSSLLLEKGSAAYNVMNFLGDKNIAVLIGVFVAYFLLKPYLKHAFGEIVTDAATASGVILAITGAGGAFGKVINETGIGTLLLEEMQGMASTASIGVIFIISAWVISQVLRSAQGSTTVALVTTSALLGPMVAGLSGVSPILVGLAICAGGIGLSLPNDSGFWVVNRFSKFDMKQTFQAWTIAGTISGLTALVLIIVLSLLSGVLPGLA
jgi:GntP family gluconate:H+ symporter